MEMVEESQLSGAYWWGVATFFRCELEQDPAGADIGLIGIPHSSGNGTTQRDQHLGPRAVRDVSMGYRRFHREYQFAPWDVCSIRDLGDTYIPRCMDNDDTMQDIETHIRKLDAAGTRPVSMGGDHSITLPILRAIAGKQSRIGGGKPVAVVHFDAHHDSYGSDEIGADHVYGNYEWAGIWAKLMADEGLVDPAKTIQIGMRGHGSSPFDGLESQRLGYRVIEKPEFDQLGVDAVVTEIRERIDDETPVYITFDMDALDTIYAPAVSNVEPGYPGLTMWEAMRVLHGMCGMNVIGADVACLMPTMDTPNKITAQNAAVIMFEQISLIAERMRQQAVAA